MTKINRDDEKLIRNFCKKVKYNLKESNSIKNDVEEELFGNIKEKAISYMDTGIVSNSAVKMAISEYESPQSVLKELSAEYKVKKFTNNKFLGLAFLLFFVSAFTILGFYFWNMHLVQKDFDRATIDVDLFAMKEIENHSTLPYLVNENPTIKAIWMTTGKSESQGKTYVYPENLNQEPDKYQRKDNIFYGTVFSGYVSDIGNKNFQIEMDIAQIHLKPTVLFIGAFMLLFSLVLFIYWVRDNIRYRYPKDVSLKLIKI
ncbi:hypothetical protein [Peribacillus aracenensis]|uniref:hypothetical protein n=1 Tax=Peribacillus aracenensis TaxID=2976708 RepID=UPI0021A81131|nr:hypothetical protein [Peribacillus sp. BBB004]